MRIEIVDGAATRELRRAVLRPNWPLGAAMHGDDNPAAVHFAAVDDDAQVIGTCLVLPRPYPAHPERPGAWQLRGMAVAAELRGHRIGAAILAAAFAELETRGGRLVWCDARTSAVRFYAAHGFVAEGEEFLHPESGTPHYRMWRDLYV